MTQFYVYIYRDPSRKNEAIYVGKGFGKRAYIHLDGGSHSVLVNRRLAKMKRNGIEPIINVVDLPSEALAHQCEIDTIARLGRKDLKLGPLLNQTDGGEGTSGRVPSVETRQKQSYAKKGKNHPMYGKSPDAETRKKQSDAKKGENNHNYGKSPSAATRQKQTNATKGIPRPLVTCPHCSKEGAIGSMQRWHFDGCKSRIHPAV